MDAPAILVDGQPLAPILFSANNQFDRDAPLLETLRKAADAGIRLFTFNLPLAWHAPPEEAAGIVEKFCEAHPEGYFLIRVWLGPNEAWREQHPGECITLADGRRLSAASPASALWREEAGAQLEALVRQVIEGPYGGRFIGVGLHYLHTAEWFYPEPEAFADYSEANAAGFRDWLRGAYRREARLQAAWNDPEAAFDTVRPPDPDARRATALGPFRDPLRHRAAIDFQTYQSDVIVDAIEHFAGVVKRASRGRALAGAFYGYTLELNHGGPHTLAHSGHLALGSLLTSGNLDFIMAPYAYFERELGAPGHFHLPVDSLALHGKLGIMEEDSYTHLSQPPDPGLIAPGYELRTTSLQESLDLAYRNAGNFLTHRTGYWHFDLLSDGRWNSRELWTGAALMRRLAAELRSHPRFNPEIAFAVCERSVHALASDTHPHLLHALGFWRAELARLGTPAGFYLQSDAAALPRSVRVLIFANPYQVCEAARQGAAAVLRRGGVVIWTGAPGIVTDEGLDPGGIARTTGISVTQARENGPVRIVDTAGGRVDLGGGWTPRFQITPQPDIEVLARYEDTNEIAAALRSSGNGREVYTAMPRLSVPLLRALAKDAGVHFYHDVPMMTGRFGPYLVVHTPNLPPESGEFHFRWPESIASVERILPPARYPLSVRGGKAWSDLLPPRTTAIYRTSEAAPTR